MKKALVLLAVGIAALWWWTRRRRPPQDDVRSADTQAVPHKVVLMEPAEDPEPRPRPKRTGETQELERRVVHGPFRPIEDRGSPAAVHAEKR